MIGSGEIRRRYARSKLGQIWVMISSTLTIGAMGLCWSILWEQPILEMLAYVGLGLLTWQFLANTILQASTIFPINSHYFSNQYIPASAIIYASIYKNLIEFALNLIFPMIFVSVTVKFGSINLPLATLGLFLNIMFVVWFSFVVAIICTRFRDLTQIINSFMQITMYFTPIFWKPELVIDKFRDYIFLNPFAILVDIIREPLLGRSVPDVYWHYSLFISIVGLLVSLPFIGLYRRRIIYWL